MTLAQLCGLVTAMFAGLFLLWIHWLILLFAMISAGAIGCLGSYVALSWLRQLRSPIRHMRRRISDGVEAERRAFGIGRSEPVVFVIRASNRPRSREAFELIVRELYTRRINVRQYADFSWGHNALFEADIEYQAYMPFYNGTLEYKSENPAAATKCSAAVLLQDGELSHAMSCELEAVVKAGTPLLHLKLCDGPAPEILPEMTRRIHVKAAEELPAIVELLAGEIVATVTARPPG